jgi:hypothetical protein
VPRNDVEVAKHRLKSAKETFGEFYTKDISVEPN